MGRPPRKATITLDAAQVADLQAPWNGAGGFQTLGPALAGRLSPSNEIELDDEEVGIIIRHMSYVSSGFRGRVRHIFRNHLTALMNVP
jgi:hypothetical protein